MTETHLDCHVVYNAHWRSLGTCVFCWKQHPTPQTSRGLPGSLTDDQCRSNGTNSNSKWRHTEWKLVWERGTHVNREEMAVPEEVKEFNKQVCSEYPGFVYVFTYSSLLILPILSVISTNFQTGHHLLLNTSSSCYLAIVLLVRVLPRLVAQETWFHVYGTKRAIT